MGRWSRNLPTLLLGVAAVTCSATGGASPEICAAGKAFTEADRAVEQAAPGSHRGREAAQNAWHQALRGFGAVLPPGEIRDATALLQSASTTVSDTTWTPEQQHGHQRIKEYLESECEGVP